MDIVFNNVRRFLFSSFLKTQSLERKVNSQVEVISFTAEDFAQGSETVMLSYNFFKLHAHVFVFKNVFCFNVYFSLTQD